jgi:uncharacterized protein YlxW (UPF0749 family)
VEISYILGELGSPIVAIIAAVVIGAAMKLVNRATDRRKDNLTEHLKLRRELREELDIVKEELRQLQRDLNEWREKYYHQLEINAVLQSEVSMLRSELDEYKETTGEHNT